MDRRHTKSSLLTDYDINAPVLHLPQKKKKLSSKCEALFLVRDLMFSCPLPKKNRAPTCVLYIAASDAPHTQNRWHRR